MHCTWTARFGVTAAFVGGFWLLGQATAEATENDATGTLESVTSIVSGSTTSGGSDTESEADGGDGTVSQTNVADAESGEAENEGINVSANALNCIGYVGSCSADSEASQEAESGDVDIDQRNTSTGDTGGDANTNTNPAPQVTYTKGGSNNGPRSGESEAEGGDGTVDQFNYAYAESGDAQNKGINLSGNLLNCGLFLGHCTAETEATQEAESGDVDIDQRNTSTGDTGGDAKLERDASRPAWAGPTRHGKQKKTREYSGKRW